jgi:starch synthase
MMNSSRSVQPPGDGWIFSRLKFRHDSFLSPAPAKVRGSPLRLCGRRRIAVHRMILFSHPTGNANVQQAALALVEAGLLHEFWTCFGWNPDSPVNRLLPSGLRKQFGRRSLLKELRGKARYFPVRELGRHFCGLVGLSRLAQQESDCFSIDAVYRSLDRKVAREVARSSVLSAVYAYEDGAAESFTSARACGLRCLYDLPIGYWRTARAIYEEETKREPEWAVTLSGMLDSPAKLQRKDTELRLADVVLVASNFTKRTIQEDAIHPGPIVVIPYGSPPLGPEMPTRMHGKRLRVLFVGGLGQRKGLSYLLKAIDLLGNGVELTLLGRKTNDTCIPLNEATRKHRWTPTLPHAEVLEEMGRHDVLVFPSLFEGFGLVILEAMSQGIPVITTPHTAGPDLIEDGRNGFIVPIRSAEAIASRLEEIASDPGKLAAMKRASYEAAGDFAWKTYRNKLVAAVQEAMVGHQATLVPKT